MRKVRVWDLPTRLFHWLPGRAGAAPAYVTGQIGGSMIEWHGRAGVAITGLLAFRIVWGIVGSTYARFADFVPTPGRIGSYLRGQRNRPGHNPLGALSVFALLAILIFQAVSGLFSNHEIAFSGPLRELVSWRSASGSLACTGRTTGSSSPSSCCTSVRSCSTRWSRRTTSSSR